jgi:hypothetical protein
MPVTSNNACVMCVLLPGQSIVILSAPFALDRVRGLTTRKP